jgi:hypothetical protein
VIAEYVDLMRDPAHWLFELTVVAVVDTTLYVLLRPFFKRWLRRHDEAVHRSTEQAVDPCRCRCGEEGASAASPGTRAALVRGRGR